MMSGLCAFATAHFAASGCLESALFYANRKESVLQLQTVFIVSSMKCTSQNILTDIGPLAA